MWTCMNMYGHVWTLNHGLAGYMNQEKLYLGVKPDPPEHTILTDLAKETLIFNSSFL